jgi:alpha-tubulin suppressor-like RCC1 family protein
VVCWGDDSFGQLGSGQIVPGPMFSQATASAPAGNVLTIQTVIANAAGAAGGGCVNLVADGSVVKCHGGASLTGVTAIAAGFTHTCALLADTTVKCWGSNATIAGGQLGPAPRSGGELGDGTTTPSPAPVTVIAGPGQSAPLTGVRALSAANGYTCALLADTTARCWGDAPLTQSLAPATVMADATHPLTGILQLAAGDTHACARLSASVVCWGSNIVGQLGNPDPAVSGGPVSVVYGGGTATTGIGTVAAVSVGHNVDLNENGISVGHSCALESVGGGVICWGANDAGQLGIGVVFPGPDPGSAYAIPVSAAAGSTGNLTGVTSIAAGSSFTCALMNDGGVRCWGVDYGGLQGTGLPMVVTGTTAGGASGPLSGVVSISAGGLLCAVISGGSVSCSTVYGPSMAVVPGLVIAT